jgi:Uma2 family endonuclease
MTALAQHYEFSVAEYEQMIAAGIFAEDARIELVGGEIVTISPMGDRHVGCVNLTADLLADTVRHVAIISVQNPIRLSAKSMPQPDIALIRREANIRVVPNAADVLIVIEVADTSRDFDRNEKFPRYGAAGIPEAWLFDLVAERIECHTEPGPHDYRQVAVAGRGETLTSTIVPGLTFATDALLA